MNIPKILIADSSRFSLELLKSYLRESRVKLHVASDGEEALRIARRVRPDLIFLDHRLPEVSGVECCATLRNDPALSRVPVILLVTERDEETVAACRASGCHDVVHKPLDRKTFLDAGRKYLAQIDRREIRIPCRATVAFKGDEGKVGYGTIEDVSVNGMYVGFGGHIASGQDIELNFLLPGSSELLRSRGKIAWVNIGTRKRKNVLPDGFGVQFVGISESAAETIQMFLDHTALRHQMLTDGAHKLVLPPYDEITNT